MDDLLLKLFQPGKAYHDSELMHAILQCSAQGDEKDLYCLFQNIRDWTLFRICGADSDLPLHLVPRLYPDKIAEATRRTQEQFGYLAQVADELLRLPRPPTRMSSVSGRQRRLSVSTAEGKPEKNTTLVLSHRSITRWQRATSDTTWPC